MVYKLLLVLKVGKRLITSVAFDGKLTRWFTARGCIGWWDSASFRISAREWCGTPSFPWTTIHIEYEDNNINVERYVLLTIERETIHEFICNAILGCHLKKWRLFKWISPSQVGSFFWGEKFQCAPKNHFQISSWKHTRCLHNDGIWFPPPWKIQCMTPFHSHSWNAKKRPLLSDTLPLDCNFKMETFIAELTNGDINPNDALDKLKEIMRDQQQRSDSLRVSF